MDDSQIEEIGQDASDHPERQARRAGRRLHRLRDATPGQRISRGRRLFQIASLDRVWVLADVFENAPRSSGPGSSGGPLPGRDKPFRAVMSRVLPVFDAVPRKLKVRLEADNPGYALRPGMFADVELPLRLEAAVTVPAEAVLQSGRRRRLRRAERRHLRAPGHRTGLAAGRPRRGRRRARAGERIALDGTVSASIRRAGSRPRPRAFSATTSRSLEDGTGAPAMIDRIIDFPSSTGLAVFAVVGAAVVAGWWSMNRVPLDALPDLSDTQVIIYSRWDRSPDLIEDQVTYPSSRPCSGAGGDLGPGFSDFGYSFVYAIFEDGTDIYWARSRTLEYLSAVHAAAPAGVETEIGPDATGLGWVYQYALVDASGRLGSRAQVLPGLDPRYYLKSVPGVAKVAPVAASRGSTRSASTQPPPGPTGLRPARRRAVRGGTSSRAPG